MSAIQQILMATGGGSAPLVPIALVANTIGGGITDAGSFTTGAIDTTGSTLLVACLGYYNAAAPVPTVTDSKGNTWQALTTSTPGSGAAPLFSSQLWYCKNPSSVGSGHTFTATPDVAPVEFLALGIMTFNQTDITANADQSNQTPGTTSPLSTGSITPSVDNSVVVSMWAGPGAGADPTVDAGLTIVGSNTVGATNRISMAYLVQTSATAINPAWTYGSPGNGVGASVANFKHA